MGHLANMTSIYVAVILTKSRAWKWFVFDFCCLWFLYFNSSLHSAFVMYMSVQLPKIRSLNLAYNQIERIENIAKLAQLQKLQLFSNKLSKCDGLGRFCPTLYLYSTTRNARSNAFTYTNLKFSNLKECKSENTISARE